MSSVQLFTDDKYTYILCVLVSGLHRYGQMFLDQVEQFYTKFVVQNVHTCC